MTQPIIQARQIILPISPRFILGICLNVACPAVFIRHFPDRLFSDRPWGQFNLSVRIGHAMPFRFKMLRCRRRSLATNRRTPFLLTIPAFRESLWVSTARGNGRYFYQNPFLIDFRDGFRWVFPYSPRSRASFLNLEYDRFPHI
jgi:hypothetical protein